MSLESPREPDGRLSARLARRVQPLRQRSLPPASPLSLALLAAVSLHLLVLAGLQLRPRRPAPLPPAPRSDNTPELLRFSRQQALEPSLAPLSVAALAQLPPPPPLEPSGRAGGPMAVRPGSATPARRTPPQRGRSAADRAAAGQTSGAARRPAGSDPASAPTLELALASLERLQGGGLLRHAAGEERGWPLPRRAQGEEASQWRRLWESASPGSASGESQRPLPAGSELRRLPAAQAEPLSLHPSQRLSLLLADRLLLIWSAGGELWILQAPANRAEAGGAAAGD